jgi:hypothetical protein
MRVAQRRPIHHFLGIHFFISEKLRFSNINKWLSNCNYSGFGHKSLNFDDLPGLRPGKSSKFGSFSHNG